MSRAAVKTTFQATGEDKTAAAFNSVAGRLDGLAKRAKVAGAIVAGAFVFKKALDKASALANEMADLPTEAARVGMAIAEYQKMNAMFSHLIDGGKELTQSVIPNMNQQLASPRARQALEAMGMSLDELSDMSSADRFKAIAVALSGMPDELERSRYAAILFGGSAKELAPMLRMGPEALADALDNVGQSIDTVDEEGANAANRLRDGFDMAAGNIKASFMSGLGSVLLKFEETFGSLDAFVMKTGAAMMWLGAVMWHSVSDATTNIGMVIGRLVHNFRDIPKSLLDAFKAFWEGFKQYMMSVINLGRSVGGFFQELGIQIWRGITGRGFDRDAIASAFRETMSAAKDAAGDYVGMYADAGKAFAKGMGLDTLEFQKTEVESLADRFARIDKDIAAKRAAEMAMGANLAAGVMQEGIEEGGELAAAKMKDAREREAKWLEAGTLEALKAMRGQPGVGVHAQPEAELREAAGSLERTANRLAADKTQDSKKVWDRIASIISNQLRELRDIRFDTQGMRQSLADIGVI